MNEDPQTILCDSSRWALSNVTTQFWTSSFVLSRQKGHMIINDYMIIINIYFFIMYKCCISILAFLGFCGSNKYNKLFYKYLLIFINMPINYYKHLIISFRLTQNFWYRTLRRKTTHRISDLLHSSKPPPWTGHGGNENFGLVLKGEGLKIGRVRGHLCSTNHQLFVGGLLFLLISLNF